MSDRVDEFDGRPELVKKRARAFILQRVFILAVSVFMTVSMIILVMNALASIKSRDILLDCTQPSGQCAKESQEETGKIIQNLIDANSLGDVATQRVVVLTAICAEEPEIKAEDVQDRRIELLTDCVNAQLAQDKKEK